MIVIALFSSQKRADRAVDTLLDHRFAPEQITVSRAAREGDPYPDGSVRVQVVTNDRRGIALRIFEDAGALDIN